MSVLQCMENVGTMYMYITSTYEIEVCVHICLGAHKPEHLKTTGPEPTVYKL